TGTTLTVSDAGTYTVTATATNGCTNTASATITKDVEKPAAPISLGDKEYCDQSTIETLAVQAPADAKYEIKWYDNSITYLASGATYTPATEPAVGGTDTYYAETYNTENHCASEEKTALTITRNALPTPTAINNTPICSGETVELGVDAYTSYIWSGPQSFTSTEQNPKIENATVDASGDYTVEVTDANGCKNTSTTTVTVNPTPELTYTAFDPLTGLEVSEPYKLDCNVPSIRVELSGGSTYQWSDGKTEQSRTIENAGTYSVYPISDKGCIGEEKTISVTSNKNKPVLKLSSKDAEGNDNTLLTCTVEELTLDVEVLNPDVATDVTYEWTFTDGTSTDKSIVVTKPDTYKMVAQAANGCYSDENQIVITQDIRVPVVTVDAPSDILTCVTEFITLEAKADIEGCTFEWNDGSTESTLKVDAEGLYSVKATATNGCVSLPAEKEVTDKTQIPVIEITPSAEKVTCENVILTASSESEGMTYVWSDEFATTGATLEVSKKGTYTVTGTNIYSCVGVASFDIDEDKSAPVITITPNTGTLTCEVTSIDVEATETSGLASVSYKWSNGKTTAKNNFTEKGTYTVTATNDATACKSEKSVTINENKQYPIVALQALEAVCLPATVDISKAVVVSESKFDDIKYYYDAAGTQPLDNPVVDVVTKQIFYVQGFGVEGSGCVGQQIYPIEVMLKDVTSTPVVNNYDECPAAVSKSLKEQVVSDRSNLTFYDMPEGGAPRSDMFDASKENTDAVYYVTNTEAGKCESERAEIDVHIDGTVDIEVTADDDEVYAGQQEVTVSAKSIKESQVNNYKWQKNAIILPETGSEVTTLLYSNTKFTVTGEGRCNSVSKEITIRALWPTLITPKTGANGHFAKGCDITVFNRFNEKVFQGNDGWDGTLDCNLAPKGEIASPGVYYYYINIPDGGTHRGTIEVVKF
ncbi:MAG: hypothetical protein MJ009_07900, partial [Paludibacteraceae bacterium]|nr:hypothetical protein [Paludibacteraceae bacterium]